jgi:hypothetical protein
MPPRLALLATLAIALAPSPARSQDDDRPETPIDVQEWSIWVATPAQTSMNTARIYRNAMPGSVGTIRPKLEDEKDDARFPIAPVSVVQFFGDATRDVDVELLIKAGNLLAYWPPAKDRSGRLQWFGSSFLAEPPADVPLPYLPEAHPFARLRDEPKALFLRSENTVERFIAYDAEFNLPIPLKLRGGPDEYTLQNLTAHRLLDVALVAPTDGGLRVGWLDELPTAVPEEEKKKDQGKTPAADTRSDDEKAADVFEQAAKGDDEPKEETLKPLPPEGDPNVKARMDQVLNRPVTVEREKAPMPEVLDLIAAQARLRYELDDAGLKKEDIDPARKVTLKVANLAARDALAEVLGNAGLSYRVTDAGLLYITTAGRLSEALNKADAAIEGPPVKLTLSQPLKGDDPSYRELTRDAYARRLAGRGLRPEVVQAILDAYAAALFEPGELIVVAHLAPEAIEEAVLLDIFPPPRSQTRAAILVLHGIDPRLQDRAKVLVEQLGDPSPKLREEAETKLFDLGAVAVPSLEDALLSKDVEVAFRAERVLLRLNRPVP